MTLRVKFVKTASAWPGDDPDAHCEVTAVFLGRGHVHPSGYRTCYAHIGQHGECADAWVAEQEPATPEEYAPLLAELRGIYGKVNVERAK